MALPFVGCREASSSLVYFAVQSAKTKEKPPFGWCFFQTVANKPELIASSQCAQLAWQSVSKPHDVPALFRSTAVQLKGSTSIRATTQ